MPQGPLATSRRGSSEPTSATHPLRLKLDDAHELGGVRSSCSVLRLPKVGRITWIRKSAARAMAITMAEVSPRRKETTATITLSTTTTMRMMRRVRSDNTTASFAADSHDGQQPPALSLHCRRRPEPLEGFQGPSARRDLASTCLRQVLFPSGTISAQGSHPPGVLTPDAPPFPDVVLTGSWATGAMSEDCGRWGGLQRRVCPGTFLLDSAGCRSTGRR